VHWRSTARYGELMVRREEQFWRNTAALFLDSRRAGYSAAMFELAVSAAASVGLHLAGEGFETRFITVEGEVPGQGTFRDTLLDTLAVLRPSRAAGLDTGLRALEAGDGQLIAIVGDLTAGQAQELAAARRGGAPGVALILAEAGAGVVPARTLAAAGWRTAVVSDATALAAAWQELYQGAARGAARG
jgi:uncharacterized protein (DUF58 family)